MDDNFKAFKLLYGILRSHISYCISLFILISFVIYIHCISYFMTNNTSNNVELYIKIGLNKACVILFFFRCAEKNKNWSKMHISTRCNMDNVFNDGVQYKTR